MLDEQVLTDVTSVDDFEDITESSVTTVLNIHPLETYVKQLLVNYTVPDFRISEKMNAMLITTNLLEEHKNKLKITLENANSAILTQNYLTELPPTDEDMTSLIHTASTNIYGEKSKNTSLIFLKAHVEEKDVSINKFKTAAVSDEDMISDSKINKDKEFLLFNKLVTFDEQSRTQETLSHIIQSTDEVFKETHLRNSTIDNNYTKVTNSNEITFETINNLQFSNIETFPNELTNDMEIVESISTIPKKHENVLMQIQNKGSSALEKFSTIINNILVTKPYLITATHKLSNNIEKTNKSFIESLLSLSTDEDMKYQASESTGSVYSLKENNQLTVSDKNSRAESFSSSLVSTNKIYQEEKEETTFKSIFNGSEVLLSTLANDHEENVGWPTFNEIPTDKQHNLMLSTKIFQNDHHQTAKKIINSNEFEGLSTSISHDDKTIIWSTQSQMSANTESTLISTNNMSDDEHNQISNNNIVLENMSLQMTKIISTEKIFSQTRALNNTLSIKIPSKLKQTISDEKVQGISTQNLKNSYQEFTTLNEHLSTTTHNFLKEFLLEGTTNEDMDLKDPEFFSTTKELPESLKPTMNDFTESESYTIFNNGKTIEISEVTVKTVTNTTNVISSEIVSLHNKVQNENKLNTIVKNNLEFTNNSNVSSENSELTTAAVREPVIENVHIGTELIATKKVTLISNADARETLQAPEFTSDSQKTEEISFQAEGEITSTEHSFKTIYNFFTELAMPENIDEDMVSIATDILPNPLKTTHKEHTKSQTVNEKENLNVSTQGLDLTTVINYVTETINSIVKEGITIDENMTSKLIVTNLRESVDVSSLKDFLSTSELTTTDISQTSKLTFSKINFDTELKPGIEHISSTKTSLLALETHTVENQPTQITWPELTSDEIFSHSVQESQSANFYNDNVFSLKSHLSTIEFLTYKLENQSEKSLRENFTHEEENQNHNLTTTIQYEANQNLLTLKEHISSPEKATILLLTNKGEDESDTTPTSGFDYTTAFEYVSKTIENFLHKLVSTRTTNTDRIFEPVVTIAEEIKEEFSLNEPTLTSKLTFKNNNPENIVTFLNNLLAENHSINNEHTSTNVTESASKHKVAKTTLKTEISQDLLTLNESTSLNIEEYVNEIIETVTQNRIFVTTVAKDDENMDLEITDLVTGTTHADKHQEFFFGKNSNESLLSKSSLSTLANSNNFFIESNSNTEYISSLELELGTTTTYVEGNEYSSSVTYSNQELTIHEKTSSTEVLSNILTSNFSKANSFTTQFEPKEETTNEDEIPKSDIITETSQKPFLRTKNILNLFLENNIELSTDEDMDSGKSEAVSYVFNKMASKLSSVSQEIYDVTDLSLSQHEFKSTLTTNSSSINKKFQETTKNLIHTEEETSNHYKKDKYYTDTLVSTKNISQSSKIESETFEDIIEFPTTAEQSTNLPKETSALNENSSVLSTNEENHLEDSYSSTGKTNSELTSILNKDPIHTDNNKLTSLSSTSEILSSKGEHNSDDTLLDIRLTNHEMSSELSLPFLSTISQVATEMYQTLKYFATNKLEDETVSLEANKKSSSKIEETYSKNMLSDLHADESTSLSDKQPPYEVSSVSILSSEIIVQETKELFHNLENFTTKQEIEETKHAENLISEETTSKHFSTKLSILESVTIKPISNATEIFEDIIGFSNLVEHSNNLLEKSNTENKTIELIVPTSKQTEVFISATNTTYKEFTSVSSLLSSYKSDEISLFLVNETDETLKLYSSESSTTLTHREEAEQSTMKTTGEILSPANKEKGISQSKPTATLVETDRIETSFKLVTLKASTSSQTNKIIPTATSISTEQSYDREEITLIPKTSTTSVATDHIETIISSYETSEPISSVFHKTEEKITSTKLSSYKEKELTIQSESIATLDSDFIETTITNFQTLKSMTSSVFHETLPADLLTDEILFYENTTVPISETSTSYIQNKTIVDTKESTSTLPFNTFAYSNEIDRTQATTLTIVDELHSTSATPLLLTTKNKNDSNNALLLLTKLVPDKQINDLTSTENHSPVVLKSTNNLILSSNHKFPSESLSTLLANSQAILISDSLPTSQSYETSHNYNVETKNEETALSDFDVTYTSTEQNKQEPKVSGHKYNEENVFTHTLTILSFDETVTLSNIEESHITHNNSQPILTTNNHQLFFDNPNTETHLTPLSDHFSSTDVMESTNNEHSSAHSLEFTVYKDVLKHLEVTEDDHTTVSLQYEMLDDNFISLLHKDFSETTEIKSHATSIRSENAIPLDIEKHSSTASKEQVLTVSKHQYNEESTYTHTFTSLNFNKTVTRSNGEESYITHGHNQYLSTTSEHHQFSHNLDTDHLLNHVAIETTNEEHASNHTTEFTVYEDISKHLAAIEEEHTTASLLYEYLDDKFISLLHSNVSDTTEIYANSIHSEDTDLTDIEKRTSTTENKDMLTVSKYQYNEETTYTQNSTFLNFNKTTTLSNGEESHTTHTYNQQLSTSSQHQQFSDNLHTDYLSNHIAIEATNEEHAFDHSTKFTANEGVSINLKDTEKDQLYTQSPTFLKFNKSIISSIIEESPTTYDNNQYLPISSEHQTLFDNLHTETHFTTLINYFPSHAAINLTNEEHLSSNSTEFTIYEDSTSKHLVVTEEEHTTASLLYEYLEDEFISLLHSNFSYTSKNHETSINSKDTVLSNTEKKLSTFQKEEILTVTEHQYNAESTNTQTAPSLSFIETATSFNLEKSHATLDSYQHLLTTSEQEQFSDNLYTETHLTTSTDHFTSHLAIKTTNEHLSAHSTEFTVYDEVSKHLEITEEVYTTASLQYEYLEDKFISLLHTNLSETSKSHAGLVHSDNTALPNINGNHTLYAQNKMSTFSEHQHNEEHTYPQTSTSPNFNKTETLSNIEVPHKTHDGNRHFSTTSLQKQFSDNPHNEINFTTMIDLISSHVMIETTNKDRSSDHFAEFTVYKDVSKHLEVTEDHTTDSPQYEFLEDKFISLLHTNSIETTESHATFMHSEGTVLSDNNKKHSSTAQIKEVSTVNEHQYNAENILTQFLTSLYFNETASLSNVEESHITHDSNQHLLTTNEQKQLTDNLYTGTHFTTLNNLLSHVSIETTKKEHLSDHSSEFIDYEDVSKHLEVTKKDHTTASVQYEYLEDEFISKTTEHHKTSIHNEDTVLSDINENYSTTALTKEMTTVSELQNNAENYFTQIFTSTNFNKTATLPNVDRTHDSNQHLITSSDKQVSDLETHSTTLINHHSSHVEIETIQEEHLPVNSTDFTVYEDVTKHLEVSLGDQTTATLEYELLDDEFISLLHTNFNNVSKTEISLTSTHFEDTILSNIDVNHSSTAQNIEVSTVSKHQYNLENAFTQPYNTMNVNKTASLSNGEESHTMYDHNQQLLTTSKHQQFSENLHTETHFTPLVDHLSSYVAIGTAHEKQSSNHSIEFTVYEDVTKHVEVTEKDHTITLPQFEQLDNEFISLLHTNFNKTIETVSHVTSMHSDFVDSSANDLMFKSTTKDQLFSTVSKHNQNKENIYTHISNYLNLYEGSTMPNVQESLLPHNENQSLLTTSVHYHFFTNSQIDQHSSSLIGHIITIARNISDVKDVSTPTSEFTKYENITKHFEITEDHTTHPLHFELLDDEFISLLHTNFNEITSTERDVALMYTTEQLLVTVSEHQQDTDNILTLISTTPNFSQVPILPNTTESSHLVHNEIRPLSTELYQTFKEIVTDSTIQNSHNELSTLSSTTVTYLSNTESEKFTATEYREFTETVNHGISPNTTFNGQFEIPSLSNPEIKHSTTNEQALTTANTPVSVSNPLTWSDQDEISNIYSFESTQLNDENDETTPFAILSEHQETPIIFETSYDIKVTHPYNEDDDNGQSPNNFLNLNSYSTTLISKTEISTLPSINKSHFSSIENQFSLVISNHTRTLEEFHTTISNPYSVSSEAIPIYTESSKSLHNTKITAYEDLTKHLESTENNFTTLNPHLEILDEDLLHLPHINHSDFATELHAINLTESYKEILNEKLHSFHEWLGSPSINYSESTPLNTDLKKSSKVLVDNKNFSSSVSRSTEGQNLDITQYNFDISSSKPISVLYSNKHSSHTNLSKTSANSQRNHSTDLHKTQNNLESSTSLTFEHEEHNFHTSQNNLDQNTTTPKNHYNNSYATFYDFHNNSKVSSVSIFASEKQSFHNNNHSAEYPTTLLNGSSESLNTAHHILTISSKLPSVSIVHDSVEHQHTTSKPVTTKFKESSTVIGHEFLESTKQVSLEETTELSNKFPTTEIHKFSTFLKTDVDEKNHISKTNSPKAELTTITEILTTIGFTKKSSTSRQNNQVTCHASKLTTNNLNETNKITKITAGDNMWQWPSGNPDHLTDSHPQQNLPSSNYINANVGDHAKITQPSVTFASVKFEAANDEVLFTSKPNLSNNSLESLPLTSITHVTHLEISSSTTELPTTVNPIFRTELGNNKNIGSTGAVEETSNNTQKGNANKNQSHNSQCKMQNAPIFVNLPVYPIDSTFPLMLRFNEYYSSSMSTTSSSAIIDDEETDKVITVESFRTMSLEDFNAVTEFPLTTEGLPMSKLSDLNQSLEAIKLNTSRNQAFKTDIVQQNQQTVQSASTDSATTEEEKVSHGVTEVLTVASSFGTTQVQNALGTSSTASNESVGLEETKTNEVTVTNLPENSQPVLIINKFPKFQEESTCNYTDYLSQNNCMCSMDNLIKELRIKVKNNFLNFTADNFTCPIFTHVDDGIILGNESVPQVSKARRDVSDVYSIIVRRETVEYQNMDKTLNEQLELKNTENDVFATPGMKIQIPCISTTNLSEPASNYSWTFSDNLPLTEGKIQETEGTLTIDNVAPQDAGNYTCIATSGNADKSKGTRYEHHVSVVSIPSYRLITSLLYNSTEKCEKGDLDIISLYLPNSLEGLMCGNYFKVCSIEVKNPKCINKTQYTSVNLSVIIEPINVIMPAINTSACDVGCEMKIYTHVVLFIIKNLEAVLKLPVFFRLSYRKQKLIPTEIVMRKTRQKLGTEAPKLVITCPPGFGYYKKTHICGTCGRNTFSRGDETFCSPCPAGQYQPMVGSKSCLVCATPLQDPYCLRIMYSNTHKFRMIIGIAATVLVLFFIILICIKTMKKGHSPKTNLKHRRDSYLKSSRRTSRRRIREIDVEMQDSQPLLDNSKDRQYKGYRKPPPEPPPPDFF